MQPIFYKFNIELIGIEPTYIKESNNNRKNIPYHRIKIIHFKCNKQIIRMTNDKRQPNPFPSVSVLGCKIVITLIFTKKKAVIYTRLFVK